LRQRGRDLAEARKKEFGVSPGQNKPARRGQSERAGQQGWESKNGLAGRAGNQEKKESRKGKSQLLYQKAAGKPIGRPGDPYLAKERRKKWTQN